MFYVKYSNKINLGGKCVSSTFKLLEDGSVKIDNAQVRENREDHLIGKALLSNSGLAVFKVSYPDARCKY